MYMMIRLFSVICALTAVCAAQTAVEYSLGVGRAGAAAGTGESAKGVFANLGKKLEAATGSQPSQPSLVTVTSQRAAEPAEKKPKPVFEDPKNIQEGLNALELTRRFGDPVFRTTGADGATRHVYSNSEAEFTVLLKESKVASVTRAAKPEQSGVVVLK